MLTEIQSQQLNAAATKPNLTPTDLANFATAKAQGWVQPTKISGPSQIPNYTNTYKAANGIDIYGIPKQLSVNDLTQSNPIVPAPTPTPTDVSSFVAGLKGGQTSATNLSDIMGLTSPDVQATTAANAGLTHKLLDQLEKLTGRSQKTEELTQKAGIPEAQKQLADLNVQIAQKTAGFDKQIVDQQGKPIINALIGGKTQLIQRQKAVELGGLSAVAQAMQGNISAAQATIKDTVDMEYQDQMDQIDSLKTQLEVNRNAMTDAQKALADKQAILLDERARVLGDQAKERENVLNLAVEAAKNGAPSTVSSQMSKATTIQDALKIGSSYLQSADTQVIDLGDRKVLINTKTGETIADLGPIDTSTDLLTNDYKNWLLSGGLEGTGKTFNEYINESKPATQAQLTASGYADRLVNSASVINDLESKFTSTSSYVGQLLPNWLKSGDRQMLEQAERDFVNAKLRQESGAVISPSEFENAKLQYFPQPGDTIEVLAQKKANRDTVINGMIRQAGSAYQGNTTTVSDDQARTSISDIYNSRKDSQKMINDLFSQGKSPQDILQVLGESGFNSVGGDTNSATLSKAVSKPNGTTGGQCGRFVNSITGLGLGDSYQSKLAKMDKTISKPQPGMVFVMPLTGKYSKYGHTGIILSVNNGIATVKDSNYSLDEKVKTHQISVSKMTGFRMA